MKRCRSISLRENMILIPFRLGFFLLFLLFSFIAFDKNRRESEEWEQEANPNVVNKDLERGFFNALAANKSVLLLRLTKKKGKKTEHLFVTKREINTLKNPLRFFLYISCSTHCSCDACWFLRKEKQKINRTSYTEFCTNKFRSIRNSFYLPDDACPFRRRRHRRSTRKKNSNEWDSCQLFLATAVMSSTNTCAICRRRPRCTVWACAQLFDERMKKK